MSAFYAQAMPVLAANVTGITLNNDPTSAQYKDAQLQAQRMTVNNPFISFYCFSID